MYWVIDLPVLLYMQNQLVHLAKKYATTTPEIKFLLVPYISSFTLQEGWHIIEWVNLFLILCSPFIMISIGYLQENEGYSRKIWNRP